MVQIAVGMLPMPAPARIASTMALDELVVNIGADQLPHGHALGVPGVLLLLEGGVSHCSMVGDLGEGRRRAVGRQVVA